MREGRARQQAPLTHLVVGCSIQCLLQPLHKVRQLSLPVLVDVGLALGKEGESAHIHGQAGSETAAMESVQSDRSLHVHQGRLWWAVRRHAGSAVHG